MSQERCSNCSTWGTKTIDCDCTIAERMSGHKTECEVPYSGQDPLEVAAAAFASDDLGLDLEMHYHTISTVSFKAGAAWAYANPKAAPVMTIWNGVGEHSVLELERMVAERTAIIYQLKLQMQKLEPSPKPTMSVEDAFASNIRQTTKGSGDE